MKLEKLGDQYGGWWIPEGIIKYESVCYLVGSGENLSFDFALNEKYNPMIHIFDPTPRAKIFFEKSPLVNNPRTLFHDVGFWDKDEWRRFYLPDNKEHCSHSLRKVTDDFEEVQCKSYYTITKELNHENIDLLKLDIEGAEEEVLTQILSEKKILPKIILVEFHNLDIDFEMHLVQMELLKYYDFLKIEDNNFTYILK